MFRSSGVLFSALVLITSACGQAKKDPPPVKKAATDPAKDWPTFRGPNRDGLSKDTGLLKKWPDDGPAVLHKVEGLGSGFSSVSMVGDVITTMGDINKECHVIAINRRTGKIIWKSKVGKGEGGGGYPGPRCTPTIDGDYVYALSQHGELVCLNIADGTERYRFDFRKDFKGNHGSWQYAESPLIDGEKLVFTPGGPEATIVAANKRTGKVLWKGKSTENESAGYSSIVISNAAGKKQYVTLTATSLISFDAEKGSLLWRFGHTRDRFAGNTANIPTPIPMGDQVFAATGYGRGAALVSLSSSGGKVVPQEEYWSNKMTNKHGGVIKVGDYLYGDLDDRGQIWCADAKTGTIKWTRKDSSKGGGSAAMTYADGMLYVRYQNGHVALVEANPEEYKMVSTFKLENGTGNCWAHPVVVDGRFYLREKDVLWVFDVRAKK